MTRQRHRQNWRPLSDTGTCTGSSGDVVCQFKIAEAVPNHDAQQWLTVGVSSEPVEDQTRSRLTAATPLRTVVRANLKSIYQHAIGCKLHLRCRCITITSTALINPAPTPCWFVTTTMYGAHARSFFNARAAPGNHSNCRQFRT